MTWKRWAAGEEKAASVSVTEEEEAVGVGVETAEEEAASIE